MSLDDLRAPSLGLALLQRLCRSSGQQTYRMST